MNIVAFWKADRRPSFVYSSHGVIWRACPDILLRITVGLGVTLRSLYPRHLKNPHHDLLAFLFGRLTAHCFLETFVPLNSHLASAFSPFGVWVVLLCFVMSFSIYNTMFKFIYHFGMGLCVYCYLVCIFVKLWSWRSIWNWLLFSNRVALVQYLFPCCLLFKLMKKALSQF